MDFRKKDGKEEINETFFYSDNIQPTGARQPKVSVLSWLMCLPNQQTPNFASLTNEYLSNESLIHLLCVAVLHRRKWAPLITVSILFRYHRQIIRQWFGGNQRWRLRVMPSVLIEEKKDAQQNGCVSMCVWGGVDKNIFKLSYTHQSLPCNRLQGPLLSLQKLKRLIYEQKFSEKQGNKIQ